MKAFDTDNIEIGRNITFNENGLELQLKDGRQPMIMTDSDKSDPDDYPFEAISYGEGGSLFGLPYNDHNYASNPEKASKSNADKNSNQLSLLAKLALAKHDQKNDLSPKKTTENSDRFPQLKFNNEARIKNLQIGNKAILLAPNKASLFSRQKNGIFMKPQLSLNSPANLLKNDFIRCICGYTHDDGLLVKCDKCMMHQHIDCVSPNNDGFVPKPYFCDICQPRQMRYAEAVCLQREKLAFINSGGTTASLLNNVTGGALRYRTNAGTFLPSRLFVTTSTNKASPVQLRISTTPALSKSQAQTQSGTTNELQQKTQNFQPINISNVGQGASIVYPEFISLNGLSNSSSQASLNQNLSSVFKSKRKQDFIYTTFKSKSELKDSNENDNTRFTTDENVPPSVNPSVLGLCEDNFEHLPHSLLSERLTKHFSSRTKTNQPLIQHYFNLIHPSQRNLFLQSLIKLNSPPAYQVIMQEFNQKSISSSKFIESHEPIIEIKGIIRLAQEYTEFYDFRKHYEPYVFFYNKFHKTSLLIDSRESGNSARFLRRSCSPNCEIKHILYQDIETGELILKFLLFSMKPIPSKTELTIPFDFDPSLCRYSVKCACDRPNCKVLGKSTIPLGEEQCADEVNTFKECFSDTEELNSNQIQNSLVIKKKPGRKLSGSTSKTRGRKSTGRLKSSLRKSRGASKLLNLASSTLKNVPKGKKKFSIRNSLIRKANATLTIAASRRNSAEKNSEKHLGRRSSGLIGRPPLKRSRIHAICGRTSSTRSRSSLSRIHYNFDNSSSSSGIDEEKIFIKREDENLYDPDYNHGEDSIYLSQNNNSIISPRIKKSPEDLRYSEEEEDKQKREIAKRRDSNEKRKSKRQSNQSKLNSSNESNEKMVLNQRKKNQTPEKSREDKWMDEVMRRIERMEKKDRRRKNSGHNNKGQNQDCKSPDTLSKNESICFSPPDQSSFIDQTTIDSNDCNLIVYKVQEKDPMAKFSRSRSSTLYNNAHVTNSLVTMALIANDELCNMNNNTSSHQSISTLNEVQHTKKRWLTQARLEETCFEETKENSLNPADTAINPLDKLLALSMTASEILMQTNKSETDSSQASSSIPNPVKHPIKKRIISSEPEGQNVKKEDEDYPQVLKTSSSSQVEDFKPIKKPRKVDADMSDLELLTNTLDQRLAENDLANQTLSPVECGKKEDSPATVEPVKKEEQKPDIGKKVKMSLSEYRRRKGIPDNCQEKKEIPSEVIDKDVQKRQPGLDCLDESINLDFDLDQNKNIEEKLSELLNRAQKEKLPNEIRERFHISKNMINIDCKFEKVGESVVPPPPPPPLLFTSPLIDCTNNNKSSSSTTTTTNSISINTNYQLTTTTDPNVDNADNANIDCTKESSLEDLITSDGHVNNHNPKASSYISSYTNNPDVKIKLSSTSSRQPPHPMRVNENGTSQDSELNSQHEPAATM